MSPISLNPATFVEGGLVDDIDALILDSRFTLYDYEGKSEKGPGLCLGLEVQPLDANGQPDGKSFAQYYSAGDKKYFTPSQDGSELVPVTDKTALNNQTNTAQFLASLITAGFPVNLLETGRATVLIGLKLHFMRQAQKKRAGLSARPGKEEKESSILLCSRIISLPSAGAGAGVRPLGVQSAPASTITGSAPPPSPVVAAHPVQPINGGALGGATPAPATGNPQVDALAEEILIGILAESGGGVTKKDMLTKAFQSSTLQGNPLKKEVVQRIYQDEFLLSRSGVKYDGSTIALG